MSDPNEFPDRSRKILQNKFIDGGIADAIHQIILPQNTTTALAALSNNLGSIAYDSTLNECVVNTGSGYVSVAAQGGAVTSVALTVPAEFSVSGSPITSSGTLAVTKATQTANTVYAGPGSAGPTAPTFRALVAADLPTIAIAGGGTGQVTKAPAFDALQPMSTLGDTIYGGASGTGTRLAGSTSATKNFLTQTGNGSISAAPAWGTLVAGDIPALANQIAVITNAVRSTSATTATLSATTDRTLFVDTTSNVCAVTFPAGSSGMEFYIKDIGANANNNNITFVAHSGDTFEASTSITTAGGSKHFQWIASKWWSL